MSSDLELNDLFDKWNELNNKVGQSFGAFDFDSIREIRDEQRIVEDKIFEALLECAPADLKKILPDECGQMEIGYEKKKGKIFFLMEDPEYEDSDELKILAITFDKDRNINTIKDFKEEGQD